jgi:hypothetical protein
MSAANFSLLIERLAVNCEKPVDPSDATERTTGCNRAGLARAT